MIFSGNHPVIPLVQGQSNMISQEISHLQSDKATKKITTTATRTGAFLHSGAKGISGGKVPVPRSVLSCKVLIMAATSRPSLFTTWRDDGPW